MNYCLKLKYGQGGRHLKGMKKASALHADWKSFQGYYHKVTRSKISQDDSEEVNAVSHLTSYQQHILILGHTTDMQLDHVFRFI